MANEWNQVKKMLVQVVEFIHVPKPSASGPPKKAYHAIKHIEHSQQSLIVKIENLTNLFSIEDDFYDAIQHDLEYSKFLMTPKMIMTKSAL